MPGTGLVSNQLGAAEVRALSEPAPAAAERIKENHSDTGRMVPRVGLEPTLLSELDFESSASTSFTTEAQREFVSRGRVGMQSDYLQIEAGMCGKMTAGSSLLNG